MATYTITKQTRPVYLPDLTDASATINPGVAGWYTTMPAATLSTTRSTTLGTGGTLLFGFRCCLVRADLSANVWAIVNGGTNGGASEGTTTTLASAAGLLEYWFEWNTVDWIFLGCRSIPV